MASEHQAGNREVDTLGNRRSRHEHAKFRSLGKPLHDRSRVIGKACMMHSHTGFEQRSQREISSHLLGQEALDMVEVRVAYFTTVLGNF